MRITYKPWPTILLLTTTLILTAKTKESDETIDKHNANQDSLDNNSNNNIFTYAQHLLLLKNESYYALNKHFMPLKEKEIILNVTVNDSSNNKQQASKQSFKGLFNFNDSDGVLNHRKSTFANGKERDLQFEFEYKENVINDFHHTNSLQKLLNPNDITATKNYTDSSGHFKLDTKHIEEEQQLEGDENNKPNTHEGELRSSRSFEILLHPQKRRNDVKHEIEKRDVTENNLNKQNTVEQLISFLGSPNTPSSQQEFLKSKNDTNTSNNNFETNEIEKNIRQELNNDNDHFQKVPEQLILTTKERSLDLHYASKTENVSRKLISFEENSSGIGGQEGGKEKVIRIEQRELNDAMEYGLRAMQELVDVQEPLLYELGLFLDKHHPASKVAIFGAPNHRGLELSKFGYASLEASRKIAESIPKSVTRESAGLPDSIQSRLILNECPLRGQPRCPLVSKIYRTADGTCNNPKNPWRGAAMLPLLRFLPPVYEDGIQRPRLSVFGNKLPLPRDVSVNIHRDKNREIQTVTLMFTQWGQFLDHDITSTVKSRGFNGSIPQCCDGDGRGFLPPELSHPSCLPIEIPPHDWFLSRFGIRCMEFVRSAPSTRINCDLGWREQINQVTPFIDASTIYGSDIDTSDSTRTFRNGKLIYGRPHNQGPLLPPDPPGGELCRSGALTTDCLQAGDGRVGETPGLTAMHTVFVRYHNKIATVLSKVNRHWSDERTFQETRKIISAIIQHVTYNEYLPIVVGPEVIELFKLKLVRNGFYKGYDATINPAIANGFATAAFRFGHSMVQNSVVRTDSQHRPLFNNVTLHEELDNIENIWSFGSVDRTILGFCNQPSQRRDEFIADELTNHLFQAPGTFFGMDLAAINIQRGRDHGIAPYTAWRKPCGLTPIKNWQDLEQVMPQKSVQKFQSLYLHVNDIDLYSGGLAEKPLRGGVVGPTFACIIAQQFLNLRNGDRFWYENDEFESSFTPAQLQQLRKISLAQVLCQTMDEIETLQPFVFLSSDSFRNIRVSCDSPAINSFDLSPWIERANFNDGDNNIIEETNNQRIQRSPTDCKKRKKLKRKIKVNPNLTTIRPTRLTSTTTITKRKVTAKTPTKITVTNFTTNTVKLQNKYGGNNNNRPQYYQSSDNDNSDVTYLFGVVPDKTTPTRVQTQRPLEVNIKIQYFPPTSTVPTTKKQPTQQKKKKPNVNTTRRPTNSYGNNVVVITKRPMTTTTTTRKPETNYYPVFLQYPSNYDDNYSRPNTNHDSVVTNRPLLVTNQRPTSSYDNENYNRPSYYPNRPDTNYDNIETNRPYFLTNQRPTTYDNDNYNRPSYKPETIVTSRPYLVTDKRPSASVSINTYDNDNYHRPSYSPDRPTNYDTNYNGNGYDNTDTVFEDKPFSTSKRPYIYRPNSNHYVYSEIYTTRPVHSDVTKRPTYYDMTDRPNYYDEIVYSYNKRPVTVVQQRPAYNRIDSIDQVYSQYFNSERNKVDSIPDRPVFVQGNTDEHDLQHKETTVDRNGNKSPTKIHSNVNINKITDDIEVDDKLDFKTRFIYQQTDNDNENNDNKRFVKISSVKLEQNVDQGTKEREGEIDLHDDRNNDVAKHSVKKIKLVDIDITPSEINKNEWIVFNETKESATLLQVPELDTNTDFSKEVPKPIKSHTLSFR